MESFEQYHHYSQNLLLAQHEVSEIIKHSLTRGEVREDFIIQYLTKTIQNCQDHLKRGFVNLGEEEQSGQADILLVKKFAETIDLGNRGNVIVNPEDCLMVIEVKSTMTGTYLNDFNAEAKRIKASNPEVVCGMFGYKADLEKKTIMNRCGYDYDSSTKTYFDSKRDPLPTFYPFIDFILLLDKVDDDETEEDLEFQGRNQLFMRKSVEEDARYYKGADDPVVRNLVRLVRSLLLS
ncbi:hypothetical protein GCM10027429_22090 [Marivirga atlantica]|jgi:hypothetical protein|uniref:DUF6602 domain-containing protein n=1 Tax=Marivirga atlantica TaxID=1548457 RepID=A0A937AFK6_9BACT|nr:DUF6602 domain-containing protein [Marivirga atlantica]MBL0765826.1 hypothetical protein [Marivirga atlantica]